MKASTLSAISIITALFTGSMTHAGENQWPSVSISSLISSKYLGFGTGNLLSKDPAIQSDLCLTFKDGIYVDIWNSRSLKGSWNDGSLGNEIDYQIGWRGRIANDLNLAVGITYFDEPQAGTFGAGDVLYPHIYLTKDFKHLSVTAGYENFTTMPGSGFQGGNLFSIGANRGIALWKDRLSLQGSAALVYDTGTLGSHSGLIIRGNGVANWNVSKNVTLNAIGMNWYVPLTTHDKRKTDAVFYSGITLSFN